MHSFKELLGFILRSTKRIVVLVIGLALVAGGIALLVLPGPGLLVIIAVAYALFGLSNSFWTVAPWVILSSMGYHTVLQTQYALGMSLTRQEESGSILGRLSAINQGGSLAALIFILITFHYGWLTFRPAFVVLGGVAFLGALAIVRFPHLSDGEEREQAGDRLAVRPIEDAGPALLEALDAVDPEDVRMFDLGRERRLPLDARDLARVAGDFVRQPNDHHGQVTARHTVDDFAAEERSTLHTRCQRSEDRVLTRTRHLVRPHANRVSPLPCNRLPGEINGIPATPGHRRTLRGAL